MSKVDLIIHILTSLPNEYEVTIRALKDHLMNSSAQVQLGIKMVQKNIILHHNCINHQKKDVSDEQAYAAYKKQYKA